MQVSTSLDSVLTATHLAQPQGHLDAAGADEFWAGVSPILAESTPYLLVDMGRVDYVSSAGIAILTRLLIRAQKLGGTLAVFGCNRRVCTIMDVVKIADFLNLRESEEEARARLKELGAS